MLVERARARAAGDGRPGGGGPRAGDPLDGRLRIGVIPTISPYLLPDGGAGAARVHPKLTVVWREEKTADLVRDSQAGALDAALLALEADIGDVEREVIARDPFVLATPPRHPLGARAAPMAPSELRDEPVLLLDDGHCFRDQALRLSSLAGARERVPRHQPLDPGADGGRRRGVTLLPELAVPTETGRTSLRVRRLAEPAPHRTIGLVWRRGSPLAGALREVAATIRTAYPTAGRRKR